MSIVSSVLVLCSLVEQPGEDQIPPAVAHINAWLKERDKGELKDVSDHAGGHKAMQHMVWAGAFNYLDDGAFVAAVRAAPWANPDGVQLLIKGEWDAHFALLIGKDKVLAAAYDEGYQAAQDALQRDDDA